MDLITSLDNKKIKYLNKLKDKKFRDTEGLFIIETENLIEEACQSNLLEEVYLLENTDHSNEHFSLDPKEQLMAVKDMRQNGLVPLGNWHSHPESPSRPSEEDKRLAYDSKASYMILSLMDRENPVVNSFHIENNTSQKEELVIE